MEEQKKEYTAPELTVVELADQLQPLCGSCSPEGCDVEMGFAPTMRPPGLSFRLPCRDGVSGFIIERTEKRPRLLLCPP